MSPTFNPVSLGGVGRATASGTSGSPTVNNNSLPGKTIYEFNGSGSITIDKPGYADIAVISGGSGGHQGTPSIYMSGFNGGGGGGGVFQKTDYLFNSGSQTVTVGAGGASGGNYFSVICSGGQINGGVGFNGSHSRIADIIVFGGGAGGSGSWSPYINPLITGNVPTTGGTSGTRPYTRGSSDYLLGVGGNGGNNASSRGGGGGGGGASGGNGGNVNSNNQTNGNGGNGTAVNITGSSVTYGGGGSGVGNNNPGTGGGGAEAVSGTANTGGGAGSGASGGSGKVIVVIG
jgi:hypothetical protein